MCKGPVVQKGMVCSSSATRGDIMAQHQPGSRQAPGHERLRSPGDRRLSNKRCSDSFRSTRLSPQSPLGRGLTWSTLPYKLQLQGHHGCLDTQCARSLCVTIHCDSYTHLDSKIWVQGLYLSHSFVSPPPAPPNNSTECWAHSKSLNTESIHK